MGSPVGIGTEDVAPVGVMVEVATEDVTTVVVTTGRGVGGDCVPGDGVPAGIMAGTVTEDVPRGAEVGTVTGDVPRGTEVETITSGVPIGTEFGSVTGDVTLAIPLVEYPYLDYQHWHLFKPSL